MRGEKLAGVAGVQNSEQNSRIKSAGMSFFWLSAFYIVYCVRPEDFVSPLRVVPLAKITGIGAFLAFLFSAGRGKRKLRDLPVESFYLLAMIGILMVSSLISP